MNKAFDHVHQLGVGISRAMYFLFSLILLGISLLLVGYGLWEIWSAVHMTTSHVMDKLLDAIGVIVISLALFDITKYLIEEEVANKQGFIKSIEESEQMLTKFLSIIAVAINMEALVFVFRTGKSDVTQLIYPIALLLSGMVVVIILGVYTRVIRVRRQQIDQFLM
jgi:hypothetical protein